MNRKDIFIDQANMYSFSQDENGDFYLEVVSGGFAMEHLVMKLNKDELDRYSEIGKSYLDSLSIEVVRNKLNYLDRII